MIEHLKSGLSVSTHVGCGMSCSYCVLSSLDGFANKPATDTSPELIVEALLSGRELFLNGQTPLFINNRTDPLLPDVLPSTVRLLDLLANASITSPVLLISKFPPDLCLASFFDRLALMYIYSYSNLPSDFNHSLLQEHLLKIADTVPAKNRFHYMRPIIQGKNDSIGELADLLSVFSDSAFSGSVVTGLRINSKNRNLINVPVSFDPNHKVMKTGLYTELISFLNAAGVSYPVYRHTSCAVAVFTEQSNRLGYFQRADHCLPSCANLNNCASAKKHSADYKAAMQELYARMGPNVDASIIGDKLVINSQISQEMVAFLKNAFGISVDAKKLLLSPSERSIVDDA